MKKKELAAHKNAWKQLRDIPVFKQQARNKLPKPFKSLGGSRIQATGMIAVGDQYKVLMFWKDGAILTDRSFYAYLFFVLPDGNLTPVFELHWHLSHKGLHCKTPCRSEYNYTNRTLAGAIELNLKQYEQLLDPQNPEHRLKLIMIFCRSCGIALPDNDPNSQRLC